MQTLHVISHTHWDREWYKTFQQFRLQLVHLIDNLLIILDQDPDYKHFMLDGQTIVLEDYLQMRMDKLPELQKYIREQRILIGPWYILPDEFLVSPEAIVRNLLIGKQLCTLFGQRMMIGYIPDPFGHVGQLAQIFNGFHMDTASLWRGVPKGTPTLFNWEAPDGSRVLLAHLYEGYGNIADWPLGSLEESQSRLDKETDYLEPFNLTSHYLMMRGSDHLEPRPELPETIAFYNEHQGKRRAIHSTLPAYFAAAAKELEEKGIALPLLKGELRDPEKAHLLPGVFSARMWIKQRNHNSETLMERWVEPFCTWAELIKRGDDAFGPLNKHERTARINDPDQLIHQAWKLLISNQPHDSICGCSIDETHNDMISRFDQLDQIAETLTEQSLNAISSEINTEGPAVDGKFSAITVYNAAPYPKTDLVSVNLELPNENFAPRIVDIDGNEVESEWLWEDRILLESNTFEAYKLPDMLRAVLKDGFNGKRLVSIFFDYDPDMPFIDTEFSNIVEPVLNDNEELLRELSSFMSNFAEDDLVRIKYFESATARINFLAKNVPALGYATWWALCEKAEDESYVEILDENDDEDPTESISNEFFSLTLTGEDGSFSLFDKVNGLTYQNLNSFIDRGDRGDEYNYTPPENDSAYRPEIEEVEIIQNKLDEMMILHMKLDLPIGLESGRDRRSAELVSCPLDVALSLAKGKAQVDVQVVFDNFALDHRLEVRFPTGLTVDSARFDGHFQIVERKIDLPEADKSWRELPRPEIAQRAFTDVSIESHGLTLANQGLPEVAVLRDEEGKAEIALTLLRCVGWLSRDDLWNRKGQAGPPLPTPGAQEQATYLYNYAIIPHGADFTPAVQMANAYQTEFDANVLPLQAGKLPPKNQMVSIEPADFLITTLKEAENESGWILRGVNLAAETIDLKVKINLPYKSAELVYLDESPMAELEISENGEIEMPVGANKIVSIFFKTTERL